MSGFHHLARGVLVRDNRVLLGRAKGYVNVFLPGGHVDFGESAKDALIREMQEEMGVACTVGDFLGIVEHHWMKGDELQCEVNQLFIMECDALMGNTLPPALEPHLTFFWRQAEELEDLEPFPLRALIQQYMNGAKDVWWESTIFDKQLRTEDYEER
ncbi:8-oxo-dGTP pyrophosphatase MutT (NUDIX family) [Sporosarcina luteola]|nr:8-oxo-dGTP pyrophosphatase MutT (NUDIX family) [Sporosarcina luteola]